MSPKLPVCGRSCGGSGCPGGRRARRLPGDAAGKADPGPTLEARREQMSWLAGAVQSHTPQQYEFALALWTPGLISDLIERRFGVRLSRSDAGRVMRSLGFTPQRPLCRATQRDAVLVERWQQEELPAIAA